MERINQMIEEDMARFVVDDDLERQETDTDVSTVVGGLVTRRNEDPNVDHDVFLDPVSRHFTGTGFGVNLSGSYTVGE